MARGRLRIALLHVCAVLAACHSATPTELLSQARAAIAAGEVRTAEIHLKNLLQQERDNAAARQLLGELLLRTGDLGGAEQNLTMALNLGADAGAVELPLLNALIAQNKFNEALEFIASRGLPRSAGDAVEIATLKGAAYRGLGQADRAVEVYRAALEADPRASGVRTELAATLLGLGRGDEARTLINTVLDAEPNFAPALLLRAGMEANVGQRSVAEATLQQVVDLEKANGARSQPYVLAMAQLVDVQVSLGEVDAAAANADKLIALDARSPLARYAKAVVEVQQNDLMSAQRRLEALVAEAPRYWPAHRLLGEINLRQGQLGQATMYLRTAVTHNPADSAARLKLAELYVRQGDLTAARNLMEGSPLAANDEMFLAFAGGASRRAGLQEQANQYFDQSEKQAPSTLQQLVGLSTLYAGAGEFERAIRVLQSSTLEDTRSQQVADYLAALIHIREGNLQAADAVAQRLQEQKKDVVWPLNLRGVIALMRADTAGARAFFGKAIELEPRNVAAIVNMARVAVVEKDSARAERYLRQALEIEPTQPVALIGLAQLAMEKRDFAAARTLLQRAPESAERMRGEADLFALEGRFAEAAQMYGQLFSLQPSEVVALRAYDTARRAGRANADAQLLQWHTDHPEAVATNFTLGSVALEKNDLQEAQRRFEAVNAANPAHAATLNNLAWLYGERKDPRAIEFGERALAAAPNNPSIADTLGWLYLEKGDAVRGLPLLKRAVAALPEDGNVKYHWAVALADTGDRAQATEILERLIADGRQFASREQANQRLNALRNTAR